MPENKRFMEAVAAKVGAKRKPMMKRKGGPSVIIAIGAPKTGPMMDKKEDEMDGEDKMDHSKMSKAEHIAYLQEKIASLKAELALLEDEDESEDEGKMAEDEQDYEDEDEED